MRPLSVGGPALSRGMLVLSDLQTVPTSCSTELVRSSMRGRRGSCPSVSSWPGPRLKGRGRLCRPQECYAHPFNHALPVFCSPCAPLDHVYGSLGSFYSESVDRLVAKLPAGAVGGRADRIGPDPPGRSFVRSDASRGPNVARHLPQPSPL